MSAVGPVTDLTAHCDVPASRHRSGDKEPEGNTYLISSLLALIPPEVLEPRRR